MVYGSGSLCLTTSLFASPAAKAAAPVGCYGVVCTSATTAAVTVAAPGGAGQPLQANCVGGGGAQQQLTFAGYAGTVTCPNVTSLCAPAAALVAADTAALNLPAVRAAQASPVPVPYWEPSYPTEPYQMSWLGAPPPRTRRARRPPPARITAAVRAPPLLSFSLPIAAIIWICAGAVIVVCLLAIVAAYFCVKAKRAKRAQAAAALASAAPLPVAYGAGDDAAAAAFPRSPPAGVRAGIAVDGSARSVAAAPVARSAGVTAYRPSPRGTAV
jgi:hypothetical protein